MEKRKSNLTDKVLKAIEPKRKPYRLWDDKLAGYFATVHPTGRVTLYLRYSFSGRSREYKLGRYGHLTATQARKLATEMAGRVAAGEDIHAARQADREKHKILLGQFASTDYAAKLAESAKSGDKVLLTLEKDFGHWFKRPMSSITANEVQDWRQKKLRDGWRLKDGTRRKYATSTVNRSVTYLRACLNYAAQRGVIDSNPLKWLKDLRETEGVVRYLSPEEEAVLRDALVRRDKRIREEKIAHNEWLAERGIKPLPVPREGEYGDCLTVAVLLSLNTGMRNGELMSLRWDDVDFRNEQTRIRAEVAKSSKSRYLPLNHEALAVLKQWRKQTKGWKGFLFVNEKTGKQLLNLRSRWTAVLEEAGIENFRWHDLRHHFASSLVMKGVSILVVKNLLGHASLDMTLRYSHLAPDHNRAAVTVLDYVKAEGD